MAALGLNVVLLVNMVGTVGYYWQFVTDRGDFDRLVRWQTA